jgi:hypothetical protein
MIDFVCAQKGRCLSSLPSSGIDLMMRVGVPDLVVNVIESHRKPCRLTRFTSQYLFDHHNSDYLVELLYLSKSRIFRYMPPKFNPDDPAVASLITSFKQFGLNDNKAVEAAKNPKNASSLKSLIDHFDLENKQLDDKLVTLIATLSGAVGKLEDEPRFYAGQAVLDGRLKTSEQISGSIVSSERLLGF